MIHILLGTRAQLIKMFPIMHLLQHRGIEYNFVFLAQHKETIYEMLDDFGLKRPDYILGDLDTDIVSSRKMLAWSFSVLNKGIRNKSEIFKGDKRGLALVHGDAPPMLLGAILARRQGLRVAAIEAGLRSFRLFRPFPEELIRVLAGKLGLIDMHFCQDETAVQNARSYPGRAIHTAGNTIVDAIQLAGRINESNQPGRGLGHGNRYAIVTLHRFETISRKNELSRVVDLVLHISRTIDLKFVLHPPTKAALLRHGLLGKLEQTPAVELVPRQNFLEFQALVSSAEFMVTDGGSNQEESCFLGIPCLLFRKETERSEGLGTNVVLSAFDRETIDEFVTHYPTYRSSRRAVPTSPTQLIVDEIAAFSR